MKPLEVQNRINHDVAESLINTLRGCHQLIKTVLVEYDSGEHYALWADRSDDTIITMIDHLAKAIGVGSNRKLHGFSTFPFDLDYPDNIPGYKEG